MPLILIIAPFIIILTINPEKNHLQLWMFNIEKKTPLVHRYVAQLANEYNEKHNLPKRYEIHR